MPTTTPSEHGHGRASSSARRSRSPSSSAGSDTRPRTRSDTPAVRELQPQYYAFPAHQQAPSPTALSVAISPVLTSHFPAVSAREPAPPRLPPISALVSALDDHGDRTGEDPVPTHPDRPPNPRASSDPTRRTIVHSPPDTSGHASLGFQDPSHSNRPRAASFSIAPLRIPERPLAPPKSAAPVPRPIAPAAPQFAPLYAVRSPDEFRDDRERRVSYETMGSAGSPDAGNIIQYYFVPHDADPRFRGPAGSGRQRVVQACEHCRRRKIKCDGGLPACTSCATRGIMCEFEDKTARGLSPKKYKYSTFRVPMPQPIPPTSVPAPMNPGLPVVQQGFPFPNTFFAPAPAPAPPPPPPPSGMVSVLGQPNQRPPHNHHPHTHPRYPVPKPVAYSPFSPPQQYFPSTSFELTNSGPTLPICAAPGHPPVQAAPQPGPSSQQQPARTPVPESSSFELRPATHFETAYPGGRRLRIAPPPSNRRSRRASKSPPRRRKGKRRAASPVSASSQASAASSSDEGSRRGRWSPPPSAPKRVRVEDGGLGIALPKEDFLREGARRERRESARRQSESNIVFPSAVMGKGPVKPQGGSGIRPFPRSFSHLERSGRAAPPTPDRQQFFPTPSSNRVRMSAAESGAPIFGQVSRINPSNTSPLVPTYPTEEITLERPRGPSQFKGTSTVALPFEVPRTNLRAFHMRRSSEGESLVKGAKKDRIICTAATKKSALDSGRPSGVRRSSARSAGPAEVIVVDSDTDHKEAARAQPPPKAKKDPKGKGRQVQAETVGPARQDDIKVEDGEEGPAPKEEQRCVTCGGKLPLEAERM